MVATPGFANPLAPFAQRSDPNKDTSGRKALQQLKIRQFIQEQQAAANAKRSAASDAARSSDKLIELGLPPKDDPTFNDARAQRGRSVSLARDSKSQNLLRRAGTDFQPTSQDGTFKLNELSDIGAKFKLGDFPLQAANRTAATLARKNSRRVTTDKSDRQRDGTYHTSKIEDLQEQTTTGKNTQPAKDAAAAQQGTPNSKNTMTKAQVATGIADGTLKHPQNQTNYPGVWRPTGRMNPQGKEIWEQVIIVD
jgi:hypothetical protein